MEKFTTHVSALLVTLAENGGNDNLLFEEVYEVLTNDPCSMFNSEIILYKQVKYAALDVYKLLIEARDEYRALVTNREWKNNKTNEQSISDLTGRYHKCSEIAALIANKASAGKVKSI